jgi:hypothetical protein
MTHADFAIALFNDTTGEVSFSFSIEKSKSRLSFLELTQVYFGFGQLIEVFDGVASPAHSGFTKPLHDIRTQIFISHPLTNHTNSISIVLNKQSISRNQWNK